MLQDRNPYTGETILEIPPGDRDDLDAAYTGATRVQGEWAAALPAERAAVMRRTAHIIETRHEEFLAWLVREAGSTRIKADLE